MQAPEHAYAHCIHSGDKFLYHLRILAYSQPHTCVHKDMHLDTHTHHTHMHMHACMPHTYHTHTCTCMPVTYTHTWTDEMLASNTTLHLIGKVCRLCPYIHTWCHSKCLHAWLLHQGGVQWNYYRGSLFIANRERGVFSCMVHVHYRAQCHTTPRDSNGELLSMCYRNRTFWTHIYIGPIYSLTVLSLDLI